MELDAARAELARRYLTAYGPAGPEDLAQVHPVHVLHDPQHVAGIDVNRPLAATADEQGDASILVAISPSDEIWIDKRPVEPAAVPTVIKRLHIENPKGSLVIQADQDSTNDKLVIVMEAAKEAGIQNVAISTDDK